MTRDEIFELINQERARQDILHPRWLGDDHGLSVLVEEVGEVAKGLYEAKNAKDDESESFWISNLESELIQVGAVIFRWLENRKDEK